MNANSMLIFLDTNILLYAHDVSAGRKHEIARRLVEDCWQDEQGCLSLQVLQEFYVNVTRKIPRPINRGAARQLVADLSQWRLHIPEVQDILEAIDLQQIYQISFWDAMILNSTARLGCKHLVTEDLSHGQIFGNIQVLNPFRNN